MRKKLFSTFLMSGYPDDDTALEIMNLCAKSGVDFIELGMPFSDPSADGPIVRMAGDYALKKGVTAQSTMNLIKKFRQNNSKTPVVWMGYFNSIYNYGIEKFFSDLEKAGATGVLTVDLPLEEYSRLPQTSLDIIRLLTPTSDRERIKKIVDGAKGFIYFVSVAGITGTKEAKDDIKDAVKYAKSLCDLPVVVGFGVKNAQIAKKMKEFADGVIVGSALIKIIEDNIENKNIMMKKIEEFLLSFKE